MQDTNRSGGGRRAYVTPDLSYDQEEEEVPVGYILNVTAAFCSVAVLYTLHGERPPAVLGDCVSPGDAIVVELYLYT